MEKKRSVGITMVGIISIALGSLWAFIGLAMVVGMKGTTMSIFFASLLMFFYPMSLAISGSFILKLKDWARKLFCLLMILMGIGSVYFLWDIASRWKYINPFPIIFLISAIFLFSFFIRPKVKEQFK